MAFKFKHTTLPVLGLMGILYGISVNDVSIIISGLSAVIFGLIIFDHLLLPVDVIKTNSPFRKAVLKVPIVSIGIISLILSILYRMFI